MRVFLLSVLFLPSFWAYGQKDTAIIKTYKDGTSDTIIIRTFKLDDGSTWSIDQTGARWHGLSLVALTAAKCDTGLLIPHAKRKADTITSIIDSDTSLIIHAKIIDNSRWSRDYKCEVMGWNGKITVHCKNAHINQDQSPGYYYTVCVTLYFRKNNVPLFNPNNKITRAVVLNKHYYFQADTITKFEPGRAGIGFDFGPCTGLFFPYGEAYLTVKPECLVNLSLTISYKKFHYTYRFMVADGSLRKNVSSRPEWVEGNGITSLNNELVIGYQLLNKKIINIIPMASAGIVSFNTLRDTGQSAHTGPYFSWSVGIAFDLKLYTGTRTRNKSPGYEQADEYWNLRIIPGIRPGYYSEPFGMKGGIFFLSLTIGGYAKGYRIKDRGRD